LTAAPINLARTGESLQDRDQCDFSRLLAQWGVPIPGWSFQVGLYCLGSSASCSGRRASATLIAIARSRRRCSRDRSLGLSLDKGSSRAQAFVLRHNESAFGFITTNAARWDGPPERD